MFEKSFRPQKLESQEDQKDYMRIKTAGGVYASFEKVPLEYWSKIQKDFVEDMEERKKLEQKFPLGTHFTLKSVEGSPEYNFIRLSSLEKLKEKLGIKKEFKNEGALRHELLHGVIESIFDEMEKSGRLKDYINNIVFDLEKEKIWEDGALTVISSHYLKDLGIDREELEEKRKLAIKKIINIYQFINEIRNSSDEENFYRFKARLLDEVLTSMGEKNIEKIYQFLFENIAKMENKKSFKVKK